LRRLGLSLILLVLVSLFALGWLGDRLFGPESTPEDNSVQLAREVTAMLAETLANSMIGVEELTMSSPTPGYSLVLMEKESLSLPQELQTQLDVDGSLTLATRSQLTVYHQVSEGGALLALSQPQDTAQQIPLKLSLTLLFYIALCALLLLWVYPLMARLKRLTTAAKVIGQGDFSHKVATSSSSSLYTIESEFNRMSQRIQSLLEDNRLLSGAVSHDLRTPLARLRFGIDALQEQQHNEISDGYLKRISQDLDAMEQLVGVLLEFVQLDRQLDELPLESVDLCDVLTDCLNATDIQDKIKVSADIDDQQHYVMGEERFTRMVITGCCLCC